LFGEKPFGEKLFGEKSILDFRGNFVRGNVIRGNIVRGNVVRGIVIKGKDVVPATRKIPPPHRKRPSLQRRGEGFFSHSDSWTCQRLPLRQFIGFTFHFLEKRDVIGGWGSFPPGLLMVICYE
jgi:hypothetical protein